MTLATPQTHIVTRDHADAYWHLGAHARILADGARTGDQLCMVEIVHPVGAATPLHIHHTQDEMFYILDGTMHAVVDGVEAFAHAGDFVFLPKGSVHGFATYRETPLRFLVWTVPGGFDQFVRESGVSTRTAATPESSLAVDPATVTAIAEAHGMTIVGPPVVHLAN